MTFLDANVRKRKLRTLVRFALVLLGVCAAPSCARADAGIPMISVSYPIVVGLLVFVILIEAAYFRSRVRASWRSALLRLGIANLFTTLLGFPITWVVMFVLEMGTWTVLDLLTQRYPELSRFIDTPAGHVLLFPVTAASIDPTDSVFVAGGAFLVLLVPSFFLSAWLEAKWVVRKGWEGDAQAARSAVWRANLWSYLFLAVAGFAIISYQMHR